MHGDRAFKAYIIAAEGQRSGEVQVHTEVMMGPTGDASPGDVRTMRASPANYVNRPFPLK